MNDIENDVVAVGLQASGKTMYLVGMYNMFSRILGEFNVSSEGDEAFLTECWEDIKRGDFPFTTDHIVKYSLRLSHCHRSLFNFGYIDPAGGYCAKHIRHKDFYLDREYKKFLNYVLKASCLLIFIDSNRLTQLTGNEMCTGRIIQLLHETFLPIAEFFIDSLEPLPSIGIVFTKSDVLFDESYDKIKSFEQLVYNIARDTCEKCHSMVFPAITSTGYCTQNEFVVSPVNIELPILFAILCMFEKLIYTRNNCNNVDKMGVYKKFSAALLSIKRFLQRKPSILYIRSNGKVEENILSNYADKILADLDSLFL